MRYKRKQSGTVPFSLAREEWLVQLEKWGGSGELKHLFPQWHSVKSAFSREHKGSPHSHLQEARQGAKTFHHVFLSPPSSTPHNIFQTFQSALRCWLVHQLHQLSGMISLHSPPTFNEIRVSGMSFTHWVLLLGSGNQSKHRDICCQSKGRHGMTSLGDQKHFPDEKQTLKRAAFRVVLMTNEGGSIRYLSEKGVLGRELH